MDINSLGQKTVYRPYYDTGLLFPIRREPNRQQSGINASLFTGYDIWNCHEVGWLDSRGKPLVNRARIVYPSNSTCLVESKSLKLYLGGFIMTRFPDAETVRLTIQHDLSEILGTNDVAVSLMDWSGPMMFTPIGDAILLDDLNILCDTYEVDPSLLKTIDTGVVTRKHMVSNLLKTNCPVTGQPDWATIWIEYQAASHLTEESLLRYIVSYREHADYHESCCEKIFSDLHKVLSPESLVVKCFFTRRGGIDINPCRFFGQAADTDYSQRFWRQ